MIDIELQRARSAMAESVTLPIAMWLEVLDELEALRQVEPVKQEPVLFDKWDVDEAKSLLPAMRQGVALLEYVAGVLPKSTEPVKHDHSGEANEMVQEPAAIANNAPNLFGQVYLTCRENGNSHEGSLAAADEAVRLHGDEAVSRQDLTLIVEQIVRG